MKMPVLIAVSWICVVAYCPIASAQININGYTEPFHEINLSSDETGSISRLAVEEGDTIEAGKVVAQLDNRIQSLQVESARHLASASSSLDAARHSLEKRQMITARIQQLISTGHATESELIRADLEESIAKASFVAAKEEAIAREIDLRRAELLLERRMIRAPFTGVVSRVHRRQGEFLSPMHPELITLIQIDKLLATFNVPSYDLPNMKVGSDIKVQFPNGNDRVGKVYSIGVRNDAESETIPVKVLLENGDGSLRSGEKCFIEINFNGTP